MRVIYHNVTLQYLRQAPRESRLLHESWYLVALTFPGSSGEIR